MATDDEDFASMFADSERDKPKAKRPKVGDVIKGKIVTVGKEAVFVDLGGKAEGQLDKDQVYDKEGKLLVKVGDVVEARVMSDAGGVLTLRTKLGRGPEARAEQGDVMRAVSELKPHHREALVAVDLAGLSYAEAADFLGVPLGTVMSRLHRARASVVNAVAVAA